MFYTKRPIATTLWGTAGLPSNPGTRQQCCEVPGDVSACCTQEVKRNRYFTKSALFKKKLR